MQAKIRDSLHKISPRSKVVEPDQPIPDAPTKERLRHAQERYTISVLYPAYGAVYAVARRETIVYPVLLRLLQFTILSASLCIASLFFLTPLTLIGLHKACFDMLPTWILFIPALGLSMVVAAFLVAVCIHKFKHQVDSIVAVEIAQHESVVVEPSALRSAPRTWVHILIWIFTLPINFIPIVGIPVFVWVHGLLKAYTFAKARAAAEDDWSLKEKKAFVWKGIWKLQFLGFWVALLELIPFIGPVFHFTNLVAKALYVADGLKIKAESP
eukprot:Blabericola_migrator_1__7006@NODE_3550_length_1686_cov_9_324892_g2203_i0_p1_GENE_NODE_3550_length_1686_cov_9_324892_g2203_i0NODE_3550_length_1686_cov_9_324892_g2203_i0_p1_ORF_typecomplete_len270_score43_10EI24/PF07264_11/5e18DUF4112/PF13430_6/1_8e03DUF4112/PF13430_6/21DUF4112/PF13430_6/0_22DUF1673/PF07895_11/5_5_NODE_3550_length_1686_cov_9_324892_g2203_i06231432